MAPRWFGLAAGILLARTVGVTHAGEAPVRAQSRLIHLDRDGALLSPGANDARVGTSSVVGERVLIPAWEASDAVWTDTVQCIEEIFAPFAVSFTELDPGDVAHIQALFGGAPSLVHLPGGTAGYSPFTARCSVIENSIVFTFTDKFPTDARKACHVMAQEIAHSYGLDHELLASDPMSYLPFSGDRAFRDQEAACGEATPRPCGLRGSTCRDRQNSYALLAERLGLAGIDDEAPQAPTVGFEPDLESTTFGGCSTGSPSGAVGVAFVVLGLRRRRPR